MKWNHTSFYFFFVFCYLDLQNTFCTEYDNQYKATIFEATMAAYGRQADLQVSAWYKMSGCGLDFPYLTAPVNISE